MIDLNGIYIKEKATSEKIPAHVPVESSTVGSASHRKMWGTGSCENLMKVCLVCRSIRSMSWVVKKASTQAEVMYDVHRIAKVTSKSSFLPKKPEKKKSQRTIVGVLGPGAYFLCIYWA